METRPLIVCSASLALALSALGCRAGQTGANSLAQPESPVTGQVAPAAASAAPWSEVDTGFAAEEAMPTLGLPAGLEMTAESVASSVPTPLPEGVSAPNVERKIVKDATMSIEVDNVTLGLSRIDGIAAQLGGYVLETRTEGVQDGRERASMRFAVPVDHFEVARERVREAAASVLDEYASGVDVSQEYVDLASEIANLEATQARVRQFLDQADTVEEALKVNAELTRIEGEIAQRKGRLQYLGQRSAFSTIAVALAGPEIVPSATPTPTITPTPTPRPPWQPGHVASDSFASLEAALQALATFAIWMIIAVLPLVAILAVPILALWWLARWLRARRPRAR